MSTAFRRVAIPFAATLVLAGCTHLSPSQPVEPEVLTALQPVEVKVGIRQSELYATFVPSTAGASGAAACGAVPGIGILLAAACGGAMGAVDASVNAARAKEAEANVRGLKDALVDVNFDQLMHGGLAQSLHGVPNLRVATIAVTKEVDAKAYEKVFMASSANAVMFVNVDYHLSTDYSTLEVSARGLIYPRSATARAAAKLPASTTTAPGASSSSSPSTASSESALALRNAVYRANIVYRARHPGASDQPASNIAAWQADDARVLKAALRQGIAQSASLLAADLQNRHPAYAVATATIDTPTRQKANLILQGQDGRLLRYPDGALHFEAALRRETAGAAPAAE